MNRCALLPFAGLLAGGFVALAFRSGGTWAIAKQPGRVSIITARAPSTDTTVPGVADMAELAALWMDGGAVEAYDALAGVPAAQLTAWLEALLPGKTYNHSAAYTQEMGLREVLVQRLAERDPAALAAWLEKVRSADVDTNWLYYAVRGLLAAGTPDASAALARLGGFHSFSGIELNWLAERDPAAALTKLLAGGGGQGMPAAVAQWVAQDITRAAEVASEHPPYARDLAAAVSLQGRVALEQFLAGLTDADAQKHTRRTLLYVLAGEGDAAAFAGLLTSQDRKAWESASALAVLARSHPDAAVEAARQLTGEPALCGQILAALAAEDPARAVALLNAPEFTKLPGGTLLGAILPALTQSWLLSDPAGARAWMTALPPAGRAFVMSWGDAWTNGLTAPEWLELSSGLPVNRQGNSSFADQALEKLKEPAALADWCASFSGEGGQKLAEQVCGQLARQDLQRATTLAFLMEDRGQTGELIAAIAGQAANKKAAEALAWIAGLPPEYQLRGLEKAAPELLRNPEAVPEVMAAVQQRIAAEPPETVEKYKSLATNAADSLIRTDPAACGSFLAGLPEAVRGGALESVHNYCFNEGFGPETITATLDWITHLPDTGVRRALAVKVCRTVEVEDYSQIQQQIRESLTPFTR